MDRSSQIDIESGLQNQNEKQNQQFEVVEQKWNCITFALALWNLSLISYRIAFRPHAQNTPILVEIYLLILCTMFGLLFFTLYAEEDRLKSKGTQQVSFQQFILILLACLVFVDYILITIAAFKKI